MHIRKITWNKSSFMLALPPPLIAALGITRGSSVIIEMQDKATITIRKLDTQLIQSMAKKAVEATK